MIQSRHHRSFRFRALISLLAILICGTASAEWTFTEVSEEAGLDYTHGYDSVIRNDRWHIAGGAASADYNRDGWPDLYVIRGDIGRNLFFVNRKDGTFEEIGEAVGFPAEAVRSSGPTFADIDGDRILDLVVGGFEGTAPRVFRGDGHGGFFDTTANAGIADDNNHFSYAFGDLDRDGDLDLAAAHWDGTGRSPVTGLLDDRRLSIWRNDGDGIFVDISEEAGAREFGELEFPYPFTPNFADINDDGWPDLLVSADFATTFILINDGDGTFTRAHEPSISDENGMGAAIGDYDGDLDLDWFVTSIWDPEGKSNESGWGITGNRLYRNRGDGTFQDVTDYAGVKRGYWGWGACFADLNNDGHLDLFHVNGFGSEDDKTPIKFLEDPTRLFINRGDGTFDEDSFELGIDERDQGRGVVCFDYDMDGDIDLFVANNSQPPSLYRNDGGNELGNFVSVRLRGKAPNTEGIGARVYVTANGRPQVREIRAGNNFVSSNPAVAHFGLADAEMIEEIRVVWPDGEEVSFSEIETNQFLIISQEQSTIRSVDPHAQPQRRRGVSRRGGN